MKRLLLLRHAKSSREPGVVDHARPLAPRGIWTAESMAEHCAKRLQSVDLALCSTAIRAHETLRLFDRCLPPSCKTVPRDDLYLADNRALRDVLRDVKDRYETVLVVGHEPGLSELATRLCRESGERDEKGSAKAKRRLAKGFKTASLLTIDLPIENWRDLKAGSGRLRSLIRPRDLR
jgi:phosphohistidine phosphatase